MTEAELQRINEERRRRGLPPLSMSQARNAIEERRASAGTDDTADFLIGFMTGIPMPSPGGVMGAILHGGNPAPACDSPSSESGPSYSPPDSGSPDSSSSGGGSDSGSSDGGGGGGDGS